MTEIINSNLTWLIAAAIFVVAILYSSVGHAGASGYIAVMSLLSLAPSSIKPTALALNILVAFIASVQFIRRGNFSWPLFWPFAVLAIPFAYLGGYINLPVTWFKLLLGLVLLYSAWFLIASTFKSVPQPNESQASLKVPSIALALVSGAAIGLLSGLTGTGGGIFLTPLLLMMNWAKPKAAAGVSALFILFNSSAGLLGNFASTKALPDNIVLLLFAAGAGGFIGSTLGSQYFAPQMIKRLLGAVLVIAGLKFLSGAIVVSTAKAQPTNQVAQQVINQTKTLPVAQNTEINPRLKTATDLSKLTLSGLGTNESAVVVIVFSTIGCPYCEVLRRSYLPGIPIEMQGVKVYLQEVFFDKETSLLDFQAKVTTHRKFAKSFKINLSPTVMVFSSSGQMLGEPLVGIGNADFYDHYLQQLIQTSAQTVRLRENNPKP
jgi:uncharacterized protein